MLAKLDFSDYICGVFGQSGTVGLAVNNMIQLNCIAYNEEQVH